MTDETKYRQLPRIGDSQKAGKVNLSYANPRGNCINHTCNGLLTRAPSGSWFGSYCKACARLLVLHGDLVTKVPRVEEPTIKRMYGCVRNVVTDLIKEEHKDTFCAANAIDRALNMAKADGMGDPRLAKRNESWLYHHYLSNELEQRHFAELVVHLMSIIGVTQMLGEMFSSEDQRDLFICKKGFRGPLPLVSDKQGQHGAWGLKSVRDIANRMRSDFQLGSEAQTRVRDLYRQRLIAMAKREAKRDAKLNA